MATLQPPDLLPPALPEEPVVPLSVPQYQAMIAAGILPADNRVELLEGWLVRKMGQNPPHAVCTGLLVDALPALLPAGFHLREQKPITLADSEPEPDLCVARGSRRDYLTRHPGANEAPLVIEVADASLQWDKRLKRRVYARAGIPVYWIVNLVDEVVEVYTQPAGTTQADYQQQQDFVAGASVPVTLDGATVGQIAVGAPLP